MDKIKAILDNYNLKEIVKIDPKTVRVTEDVRAACEKNDCGQYGKNYMCPPHLGPLEECKEMIYSYDKGVLFSQVHFFKNRQEYKHYDDIIKSFTKINDKIHREIRKSGIDGKVLSAGGCTLCKTCGLLEDLPCRFPEDAKPSLEGCGVDVVHLSKATGLVYNNGPKSITIIGMVLYNDEI